MQKRLGYPLRGAIGFGLGLACCAIAFEYLTLHPQFPGANILAFLIVPFAGGVLAATIFVSGGNTEPRAIPGFGCGLCLLWFVVSFAHISLQGGPPDYGWGAIGCAIGFALGGGLGGATMRLGLLLPGAITFGLAGAIAGPASFYASVNGFGYGVVTIMTAAGALAGALFGFAVEVFGN